MAQNEKIPLSAFKFASEDVSISEGANSEAEITVLARSGKPINHWYWGAIVHDMQGFRSKSKVCFDYCHDDEQIIGYADKQEPSNEGLTLAGKLVSIMPGDRADVVMKQGAAGVPFEASIFFDEAVLEWIPEGTTTEVNGSQFAGPGVVAREWRLRGCAICPYGADGETESEFADASAFHFSWRGKPMPRKAKGAEKLTAAHDTTNETEEAVQTSTETEASVAVETQEGGDQESATEEANADQESQEASQLSSDPRHQLKKYMLRFGDADGAKFFADGLDWSQAQDKFIDKLCAERDAAAKRAEDAEAKLSVIGDAIGEKEVVKTGALSTQSKGLAKSISEAKKMASEQN